MAIEEGAAVRQKAVVVEGVVVDTEYDKDNKQLKHLVEYADADGETQQRWFLESEIEEAK